MGCPPILTENEVDEIITKLQPMLTGPAGQQRNELKHWIAYVSLRKLIGEPTFTQIKNGQIKSNSFLDYILNPDRFASLRFSVIVSALDRVHCRPGFKDKLIELLRSNYIAVEYELRVASFLEQLGWPVNFDLPSHASAPELEINWSGIPIGIECKWKVDLRGKNKNQCINSMMSSLNKARKKFKKYNAGFIFIGGFLDLDKYRLLLESHLQSEIRMWIKEHRAINIVFFYPIIETEIPEKSVILNVMGVKAIFNTNPYVELDSNYIRKFLNSKFVHDGKNNLRVEQPLITKEDIDTLWKKLE